MMGRPAGRSSTKKEKEIMKFIVKSIAAALVLSAMATFSHAQIADKKGLTLDGAKKVIAAGVAAAKSRNAPGGVIAVVDEGGNLMATAHSLRARSFQSAKPGPPRSSGNRPKCSKT